MLLVMLLLVACTSREIHTEVTNPDTAEELSATACTVNEDCMLHNSELAWACCYAGSCQDINYSEDKWIPLNAQWLAQERQKWCTEDCGPAPACPVTIVDAGYSPSCVEGVCVKIKN